MLMLMLILNCGILFIILLYGMGIKRKYYKKDLIDQILKLNESLGRPPTKKDINNNKAVASWSTFLKEFKSISNLYKESGIILSKYHVLTNTDLKELYFKDNKSPREISILTKKSTTSIYKRLNNIIDFKEKYVIINGSKIKKCNIKIDTKSHQIIDGIMISDGYLSGKNKLSLCIGQKYDKEEFIVHIAKELPFNHSIKVYKHKNHWQKNANDEIRYRSRSFSSIYDYAKRWYDESGTKVVPKDFIITPISLLYWFCGDGSIHKTNKKITLHTNSFNKDDLNFLLLQFKCLGIHCTIDKRNVLNVRLQSTNRFFDFLGWNPPFKCFAYKWLKRKIIKTRMTIEEKETIINLYKNNSYTTSDLSKIFKYSNVAISRMLRINIPKIEYEKLKYRNKSNNF